MTATAAQILQLRRMVAELTVATYTDAMIQAYIEKYPLLDERGEEPYEFSGTTPPVATVNAEWIATYDINAAAGDIWEEKAAAVANQVNFSADGGNYSASNKYEQAMKMVRHYRARRAPKSGRVFKWPEEVQGPYDVPWIANLPEPTENDF